MTNIHCQIRNDGIPPRSPLVEKGGLQNIRQSIEGCGGQVTIQGDTNFILDLTWPKGVNYDL